MKLNHWTMVIMAAAALSLTACDKKNEAAAPATDQPGTTADSAATPAPDADAAAAPGAVPPGEVTPAPVATPDPVAATPDPAIGNALTTPTNSTITPTPNIATLPGGTQYEDLQIGHGEEARPGQQVVVHYTGTLVDGTKFDSSRDRNEPFTFGLGAGQVIKGWDAGVAGMKVGGRRKLTIPADQGYGPRDMGVIPPNSTLLFDVELIAVK